MSGVKHARTAADLERELAEAQLKLAEAEETLEAIRTGAVDAFFIQENGAGRVYTLQAAERPYRVLVESMQQGALVLGTDGTILFANGRVAELLDLRHERLTGSVLRDLVESAGRGTFDALLKEGFREGAARGEVQLTAGKRLVPAHLTIAKLPSGDAASLCVIVTDLTREKQHEVLERDRQVLHQTSELLREADRRKDEFLATLAHELRMPLAPVRSALEVIKLKGAASPDVEWAQNVIERQVRRMTRLVDDLLDLGRITHDQLTLRRAPVDLSEALRGALETAGPMIEEAGHELLVVMPRDNVVLDADQNRLTQVFANLLTNAACFTERFGSIEVRGVLEGDQAAITIRDNGAGITPEVMPHIYEMFRRTDRSMGHERTGLGVGLALVKKIVELHGGSVEILSDGHGKGCTATVRLPVSAEAAVSAPGGIARGSQRSGHRILIVDDNVDTADALAALLRLYGDVVRTAYSGTMALELGKTFEPQVVLLDIAMPEMDGYETCRGIRAEEWGRDAHIIAVTGWGKEEDRARTRDSGFDHHLLKPVDPTALSVLLRGLGSQRRTPWPEIGKKQRR